MQILRRFNSRLSLVASGADVGKLIPTPKEPFIELGRGMVNAVATPNKGGGDLTFALRSPVTGLVMSSPVTGLPMTSPVSA